MNIKDIMNKLFGSQTPSVTLNVISGQDKITDTDNPIKTDRTLARQLYHNTNKAYTLSAHLLRPIINSNVNFTGTPTLFGNNKALQVVEETKIDYRKIHKSVDIDGDLFVWPQWDMQKGKIKLVLITNDIVNKVFVDPLTKEVYGYRFVEKVNYSTPTAENQQVEITYIVTKDRLTRNVTGSMNQITSVANKLGILPIVHFANDTDTDNIYGHSEIEHIIPQLKFYHDLTYEAGAAQSRDGHPKLKVTTKNVKQWIENNFGTGAYAALLEGKATVSMQDRDLFINAEGDDVNYLYLNKTSGDYSALSQIAFTNIVEGSEIPEINFGASIGTSLASVKEYRPIWIKKIEAKQFERTQPWLDLYDIILKTYNFVHLTSIKNDISIVWEKPNFASNKEQAEIIGTFSKAIETLKNNAVITAEEIYNTIKELGIIKLFKTYKEHEKVIKDEQAIIDAKAKAQKALEQPKSDDEPAEEEPKDDN